MVDYHVHIGQYGTLYFQPYRVVKILKEVGVSGAFVSSTTSCMTWENREEMNLIISHIKDEFYEGCEYAKSVGFGFRPLLWCVPNMYSAGVSVTEMIRDANYCGLKIHPRANVWDFNNQATLRFCEELFEFARDKKWPVFIHTGLCDFERADKFEKWFSLYSDVKFVLCHTKDLSLNLTLMKRYDNVYGDVAFSDVKAFVRECPKSLYNKFLFGSDFPVNCLTKSFDDKDENAYSLLYKKYIKQWAAIVPLMCSLQRGE